MFKLGATIMFSKFTVQETATLQMYKQYIQELSYRKQIVRQLRTQYVQGIYRSNYP